MPTTSLLRNVYLLYFSKPIHQRPVLRAAASMRARRIVQIGVGTGGQALRLLEVVRRYHGRDQVRFTGIDLFEARPPDAPGLTLKRAHKLLRRLASTVQLLPGDPQSALARGANAMLDTDLLVISADQSGARIRGAAGYLPRMLHERSLVFIQYPDGEKFEKLTRRQFLQNFDIRPVGHAKAA